MSMNSFCNFTQIFTVLVMVIFCSSCSSNEPTCKDWDRDWDENYERYEYTFPQPFDDIQPDDVIWHGEYLRFKSVIDMLKNEASKKSKQSKTIKTSAPGMIKDALGSKALEIDKLVVVGPIDEYDITYIKRCIAAGNLRSLDLSKAILPDNKLPDEAFVLHEYPYMNVHYPAYLPLFNIVLPDGIEIGDYAFLNSLITEIDLSNVVSIGCGSFQRTVFLSKTINLTPVTKNLGVCAFEESGDGNLVVNFNQKVIPLSCFFRSAIKEINLADGLELIDMSALSGIHTENLILPNTLKTIDQDALCSCRVRYLSLPASIQRIGMSALEGLKYLETLDVYFTNPDVADGPKIGEDYKFYESVFGSGRESDSYDTPHNVNVIVPEMALEAFKSSPTWSWFDNITAR